MSFLYSTYSQRSIHDAGTVKVLPEVLGLTSIRLMTYLNCARMAQRHLICNTWEHLPLLSLETKCSATYSCLISINSLMVRAVRLSQAALNIRLIHLIWQVLHVVVFYFTSIPVPFLQSCYPAPSTVISLCSYGVFTIPSLYPCTSFPLYSTSLNLGV